MQTPYEQDYRLSNDYFPVADRGIMSNATIQFYKDAQAKKRENDMQVLYSPLVSQPMSQPTSQPDQLMQQPHQGAIQNKGPLTQQDSNIFGGKKYGLQQ